MGKVSSLVWTGISALGCLYSLAGYSNTVLIWNRTPSVPTGLYHVTNARPERGILVAYKPTDGERTWLTSQNIVGENWPLLKYIAALQGDRICWNNGHVYVNDRAAGQLKNTGSYTQLSGCKELRSGDVFLLSPHPDSVDGRYFGVQKTRNIIGAAVPIWTKGPVANSNRLAHPIPNKVYQHANLSHQARLKYCRAGGAKPLSGFVFFCDRPSPSLSQSATGNSFPAERDSIAGHE